MYVLSLERHLFALYQVLGQDINSHLAGSSPTRHKRYEYSVKGNQKLIKKTEREVETLT